ncbi:hypothetical protein [Nostoc sp. 'Lobaria pulmonaria (5183) cyanobiont']|uniref:hypothetical protein n=1 Tax=Nostoc sp. 'Lobaria pulmonaria (5183) cyanobiont' TaxID=1618022 RepID=UPI000CF32D78|nr:hypothetical protein [Nostoc sp. 'Lobaria pulmonaria (5183) cyanobiont']AVH69969.1 hypothetical protein NLP_1159 [Nostoc sp. 'Lobaria pulmonaria (5183) cyanobiont']
MSQELSADDLHEQAKRYREIAMAIQDKRDILQRRIKDLKEDKAPKEEIKDLENKIEFLNEQNQRLMNTAKSLDAQGVVKVMTNLENAKQRIEAITDKVLKAVQKFDDIKEALNVLSPFINLATAIATGGTVVAKIDSIVSELDNLTRNV